MARIFTILGPKKSQRWDLFFQKFLNERRNEETDKNFENFSKIFDKNFEKKLEIFMIRPLRGYTGSFGPPVKNMVKSIAPLVW